MFDPPIGRFIQRDPTGFAANDRVLYGYGRGNPLMSTDPTGLGCPCEQEFEQKVRDRLQSALRSQVLALVRQMDDDRFLVRERANDELRALARGREAEVLAILGGRDVASIITSRGLEVRVRVERAQRELAPPPPPEIFA